MAADYITPGTGACDALDVVSQEYLISGVYHCLRKTLFLYERLVVTPFDPRSWDQSTESECIGLAFLSSAAADAVEIGSRTGFRGVKKEMAQLMKHDGELFGIGQMAVDGYVIAAHHTVVKAADA